VTDIEADHGIGHDRRCEVTGMSASVKELPHVLRSADAANSDQLDVGSSVVSRQHPNGLVSYILRKRMENWLPGRKPSVRKEFKSLATSLTGKF
jgi:hypothetical protein